jgi:hypothetical protein
LTTGFEQERDLNRWGDQIVGKGMARQKDRGRTEPCDGRDGDESDEKKNSKYNVARLGDIPLERDDGTMRVLVSQMGGSASKEIREIKIAATEQLIRTYDISFCVFMELNFNWVQVNLSANLASWFHEEEHELWLVMAHNTMEYDGIFGKHQPGGTGMIFRHEFAQCSRKPSVDPRGLG